MRRLGVCALMMSLCLLAACGGGRGGEDADQLALDLRGRYLALSGCTARLELTADYGERVYEYGLDLSYQREGDTTLTVTAPEGAAGVTARISGDETFLEPEHSLFSVVSCIGRLCTTCPRSSCAAAEPEVQRRPPYSQA